jgi:hypothetical protein
MNSKPTIFVAMVISLCCPAMAATDDLLQGEVHQSDHLTRIKRPDTLPLLQSATHSAQGQKSDRKSALIDLNDFEFAKKMIAAPRVPRMDNTAFAADLQPPSQEPFHQPQRSEVDDREMIIAWEQWHKRLCEALYQNWTRFSFGLVPGSAHTTITVTRNHNITVTVGEIDVDPRAAVFFHVSDPQETFANRVLTSVRILDGSALLEFPARSRRTEVTITPNFEASIGNSSGYDWKHGDIERVPQ